MTGRPVPSRYDESDQSIDPTATPIGSPEVVRPPGATAIMPGAATPDQRPPLNLNSATAAELERLPGIGPALAARIVADRQRHGPYRRLEELDRVSGIGPTLLVRLRPLVTV
jgi:competence protein ComEA